MAAKRFCGPLRAQSRRQVANRDPRQMSRRLILYLRASERRSTFRTRMTHRSCTIFSLGPPETNATKEAKNAAAPKESTTGGRATQPARSTNQTSNQCLINECSIEHRHHGEKERAKLTTNRGSGTKHQQSRQWLRRRAPAPKATQNGTTHQSNGSLSSVAAQIRADAATRRTLTKHLSAVATKTVQEILMAST